MTTQMNTRIDGDVKRRGDEVFARLGYSPSQVVRAVWGFAARNDADERVVAGLIDALDGKGEDAGSARRKRIRAARRGCTLVEEGATELGIGLAAVSDSPAYGELRDLALEERLREKGLL